MWHPPPACRVGVPQPGRPLEKWGVGVDGGSPGELAPQLPRLQKPVRQSCSEVEPWGAPPGPLPTLP